MSQQAYYNTKDITSVLRSLLENIQARHVFIVHGKGSYKACGAAEIMTDVCKGLQVTEYVDFSVNPKDEEVLTGVRLLLETKPDVMIAIGYVETYPSLCG